MPPRVISIDPTTGLAIVAKEGDVGVARVAPSILPRFGLEVPEAPPPGGFGAGPMVAQVPAEQTAGRAALLAAGVEPVAPAQPVIVEAPAEMAPEAAPQTAGRAALLAAGVEPAAPVTAGELAAAEAEAEATRARQQEETLAQRQRAGLTLGPLSEEELAGPAGTPGGMLIQRPAHGPSRAAVQRARQAAEAVAETQAATEEAQLRRRTIYDARAEVVRQHGFAIEPIVEEGERSEADVRAQFEDRERQIRENFQANEARIEAIRAQIDAGEVDPDRYWANASTGSKVLAILGLVFGTLAEARGGTNTALRMLSDAVERDIALQEQQLGRRERQLGRELTLMQFLHRRGIETEQLGMVAREEAWRGVQRQIDSMATQATSADQALALRELGERVELERLGYREQRQAEAAERARRAARGRRGGFQFLVPQLDMNGNQVFDENGNPAILAVDAPDEWVRNYVTERQAGRVEVNSMDLERIGRRLERLGMPPMRRLLTRLRQNVEQNAGMTLEQLSTSGGLGSDVSGIGPVESLVRRVPGGQYIFQAIPGYNSQAAERINSDFGMMIELITRNIQGARATNEDRAIMQRHQRGEIATERQFARTLLEAEQSYMSHMRNTVAAAQPDAMLQYRRQQINMGAPDPVIPLGNPTPTLRPGVGQ